MQIKSRRIDKACNQCRKRRSKCNGQSPCGVCSVQGTECSFYQSQQHRVSPKGQLRGQSIEASDSMSNEESDYSYSMALVLTSIVRSDSLDRSSNNFAPCIESYFEKFHPEWPFLHRATFQIDQEPALLQQSIVMIGLLMMNDSEAHKQAARLHSKLITSINQQRVSLQKSTHVVIL